MVEQASWVRDYYDSTYLEASTAAVSNAATECEVGFLRRHVLSSGRQRIVDACSGRGRHALLLAADGHEVAAVDLHDQALRQLETSVTPSLNIRCIHDDVRNLGVHVPDGWADVALCLHNSFGYDDAERAHLDFLGALSACLRRGGLLVLDIPNKDLIVGSVMHRGWERTEGGTFVLGEYLYDSDTQRVIGLEHRIPLTGTRSSHRLSVRLFSLPELEELFNGTGFEVRDVFGDFQPHPYMDRSERLLVVARRR
jgi:SAM-dependent methyltransferase